MTSVTILTPEGRGAVATILVRGPQALAAVASCFRPAVGTRLDCGPLSALVNRPRFGRWNGPAGEETVLCVLDGESIEVHCHGGVAAVAAVVASLVDAGCQANSWDELLLATERDPLRCAAEHALAHATTERTATILLDQHQGALRCQIEAALEALRSADQLRAHWLIDQVLANARVGLHLATPFRVVLVGEPNVGKSSLMNALLGYERTIVHETPGTTRDAVTATTAIDGWPVELVDTAGIRVTSDPVEQAGVARARERAQSADLVIRVIDRSVAAVHANRQLFEVWPDALVVYSKCDLPAAQGMADELADCQASCSTSAKTRLGIPTLLAKIALRLVPVAPTQGAAVPFTLAQVELLETARRHLLDGSRQAVEKTLVELVGR